MGKRGVYLAAVISLVFWAAAAYLFAQGNENLRVRLYELRQKKAQLTHEYESEFERVNRDADEKLAKVKEDFHKAREECLQDKQNRTGRLREDYEQRIRPIIDEERQVVEAMAGTEGMNFAKPRVSER